MAALRNLLIYFGFIAPTAGERVARERASRGRQTLETLAVAVTTLALGGGVAAVLQGSLIVAALCVLALAVAMTLHGRLFR